MKYLYNIKIYVCKIIITNYNYKTTEKEANYSGSWKENFLKKKKNLHHNYQNIS